MKQSCSERYVFSSDQYFQAIGKKLSETRTSAKGDRKRTQKASSSASRDNSKQVPVQRQPTMSDQAAMDNLYYIAHNAADALVLRGFGPPRAGGKSKKKGGRKGRKKK